MLTSLGKWDVGFDARGLLCLLRFCLDFSGGSLNSFIIFHIWLGFVIIYALCSSILESTKLGQLRFLNIFIFSYRTWCKTCLLISL